jgi:nucleotide-binding universal stress UspA family protein
VSSEDFPAKILLATDGSEDAARAARAAADLSGKTGAELHVVHAWQEAPQRRYSTVNTAYLSKLYADRAWDLLERQGEGIERAGAKVAAAHRRLGRPAEEIVELAGELGVGLVVVGSRGLGAVRRLATGSVSEGVVHHASCPVLVVRGAEGAWPPERVVVGDDGSEEAEKAGELASSIAGLCGAETVVVRAYENPPEPVGGWSAEDRRELDEALERERQAFEERAVKLGGAAGVRPETRLAETEPTLALLMAAEEGGREVQTLIAVGSRGLGAAKRALLGSVSSKVVRTARGSVLVCPHGTRREG